MFKSSMKLSFGVVFGLGILFSGCGENSTEASKYNVEMWLDSGENQKVLDYLGDCSTYSDDAKDKCYLDVGAAYFGMANFDMISLAKEFSNIDDSLSNSNKSKEFNKIIFTKLDNPKLKDGIDSYTKVVDGNESVCNEKNYDVLKKLQKQACLSINPTLISNIVAKDDDNKSENVISLNDIISFKNALQNAVPELKAEELIAIIDGDDLSIQQDINQNNKLDSVEATDYALKVFALSKAWDGNNTVSSEYDRSISYTNTPLNGKTLKLVKVNVSGINGNSNKNIFYRVVEFGNDYNTTLTTIPNTVCNDSNIVLPSASISDITNAIGDNTYLPCIKIVNNKASSLNDSVVNILNNDDLLTSMALSSKSKDKDKTDIQKVSNFKNDICDINGTATSANYGDCTVDANGTITITQEAIINYMSKEK